MRPIIPVECAAELCGVSHKTDFVWWRLALATATGYQDWFVLCGTFWVEVEIDCKCVVLVSKANCRSISIYGSSSCSKSFAFFCVNTHEFIDGYPYIYPSIE